MAPQTPACSLCRRWASCLLGLDAEDDDSVEKFFEDTVRGGKFLNDQTLVAPMVEEVGPAVRELMDAGLRLSDPIRAPGHRHRRGVWGSGVDMLQILSRQAQARGVKFIEEFYTTDVVATADGVAGVVGIDLRRGDVLEIGAKAVILATGGGMMLYPFQTAPEELTGDGYWMALAAGAELIEMEMVQFLPCVLVAPPIWRGIQFPWLLGPQSGVRAWLLNRFGERFMARWDPENMEMATRDVISIASAKEILDGRGGPGGGIFLSWAHLPRNVLDFLPHWYGKPHLRTNWKWEGFDFKTLVDEINKLEPKISGLKDAELKAKTAELKEKLGSVIEAAPAARGDLVARDALVELGYTLADAERALAGVDPELPAEERVRQALRRAA